MRLRLAPLAAVAVGAALLALPAGASAPTRPLSSLGQLRPAPYPGDLGPELVPIPDARPLAQAASRSTPTKSVAGIKCERNARLVLHTHAHLTLFLDGRPVAVPAGIGIWPAIGPENYRFGQFGATHRNCLSWLSTRYADGLVHIEASTRRAFVLGEFFAVWGQPLSRTRVGPARGAVTAIVNRRVWTGDPRRIPLRRHSQIQLEVGRPLVEPQWITFPGAF